MYLESLLGDPVSTQKAVITLINNGTKPIHPGILMANFIGFLIFLVIILNGYQPNNFTTVVNTMRLLTMFNIILLKTRFIIQNIGCL